MLRPICRLMILHPIGSCYQRSIGIENIRFCMNNWMESARRSYFARIHNSSLYNIGIPVDLVVPKVRQQDFYFNIFPTVIDMFPVIGVIGVVDACTLDGGIYNEPDFSNARYLALKRIVAGLEPRSRREARAGLKRCCSRNLIRNVKNWRNRSRLAIGECSEHDAVRSPTLCS